MTPVRLLLVAADADALAARLAQPGLALEVTAASSTAAARAHLAGTAFDAVTVADAAALPGLVALCSVLGHDTHVIPLGTADELAGWLSETFADRLPTASDGVPPARAAGEQVSADAAAEPDGAPDPLRALRADLARAAHDLGGPLAVVSGNAQLGRGLARALGADPELAEAFEQIEEAAVEMARRVRALGALRHHLDGLIGDVDDGAADAARAGRS